jgi:hypothetical protein
MTGATTFTLLIAESFQPEIIIRWFTANLLSFSHIELPIIAISQTYRAHKETHKSYFCYFLIFSRGSKKICKLTETKSDKHWNSISPPNPIAEVKERVSYTSYFPSGIQGMLEGDLDTTQAIQDTVLMTFYSLPVTWCITSLTINNCTLCPHCIYVFCIYLRTNSDLCYLQHKLIGFYNRDEKCLQRGTDWIFK